MKTITVYLTRTYQVDITTKDPSMATHDVEFYLRDPIIRKKDLKHTGIQSIKIKELLTNDAKEPL